MTLRMFCILTATTLSLGTMPSHLFAQDSDPNDMAVVQVLVGLGELTDKAREKNYGLDDGFSFAIGFLKQGDQKGFVTPLTAGESYMFVGKGDSDVKDLDIAVVDENNNVVAADTMSDSFPIVSIKPTKTGRYRIRLKLESASAPSFCGLVALKQGAPKFSKADLVAASSRMMGAAGRIRKSLDGNVNYETDSDEWSILGAILQKGESTSMGAYEGAGFSYVIYGVGDDDAEDLDLTITDAETKSTISSDTKDDAIPVCEFKTGKQQNYNMKLSNTGNKAALSFAIIMRKK